MRVVISSGHSSRIAGASGVIQEVPEARRVVAEVTKQLRALGATVTEYHDSSTTVAANLNSIVAAHNAVPNTPPRLDVSVHFNHSGGGIVDRAIGTEVLYFSAQAIAARISKAMADAGGFINRGAKRRTDLRFLTSTRAPGVLLEVCFVNSRADVALYQRNFSSISLAIARSILGLSVSPTPAPPAQQQVCQTCGRPL
jgi:N-acetylmuramoyl-L-alanine amidase